jgi:hypothetical protein
MHNRRNANSKIIKSQTNIKIWEISFLRMGIASMLFSNIGKGLRYAEDNKLRATLYSNIAICYIKL